jgi:lysophospholipase
LAWALLLIEPTASLKLTTDSGLTLKSWNSTSNTEKTGTFLGAKQIPIYYRKYKVPNEKGSIIIVQGFNEASLLHAELHYDLTREGYSVYELDHRGQGFSGRLISDPEPGYVDRFDYFEEDLDTFVETVVKRDQPRRLLLLANSMGGAIAALALARHPEKYQAAVLAVPMLEVDVGSLSERRALEIIDQKVADGKGAEYSWEQDAFDPTPRHDPNSPNGLEKRAAAIEKLILSNREIAKGGASWQWMGESIRATQRARGPLAQRIQTPVLLLQAGRDATVHPGGQAVFCRNAPTCHLRVFPSSGHGLIFERDEIRDQFLTALLDFFLPK